MFHQSSRLGAPPHRGNGTHLTFVDQYTKLTIWTLGQISVKTAVYLDADTTVRRNFDELWNLPFEFGAVSDIWVHSWLQRQDPVLPPLDRDLRGYGAQVGDDGFQTEKRGAVLLEPPLWAESVRPPYAHGRNLAIRERSPEMWKAMQSDMRIVHYTAVEPSDFESKCPNGVRDQTLVYDIKK